MPRARKALSGVPAQAAPTVAPQTYGQGVEQQQLNTVLPAPNMRAESGPQRQQSVGRDVVNAVQRDYRAGQTVAANAQLGAGTYQGGDIGLGALQYDHGAAMQAAAGLRDLTGLLEASTNRPNEPITAGLSSGPGPGPEILGMTRGTPAGDLFRRLSQATSDPYFAELAARARA